jgi:dinuclear metal center YbgI/SA1388 family protein
MTKLSDIAAFLDRLLKAPFTDSSNNGLQVQNSGHVRKVCGGVDASLPFFRAARERGADLVICHHGLSWGDSLKYITDLNYQRLAFLIRNDMAVYASHLPLDGQMQWGNNAELFRRLGVRDIRGFAPYKGGHIGVRGRLARAMKLDDFAALVGRVVGNPNVRTFAFGRKIVRTVAGVAGGGAVGLDEAGKLGIDVYLSGEGYLSARNSAEEWGLSVVLAGHYATEKFGVQSLLKRVKRRFAVETEFIDMGIEF